VKIHPTAIVEDGARLAADVEIGPFCRVGGKATLEAGVVLKSHVVVDGRTTIGARTVVHPFAYLGGPPQHLGYRGEDTAAFIGADCVIRENATVNLGTPAGRGETRIGDRCFMMAGAHVAHDCVVADNVVFANCSTLGGHVVVGEGVFLGGLSAVHQHCRVGAFAFVGGCAAVVDDIIPYGSAIGNRATLEGLNLVGMKRRSMARPAIHDLRATYRGLFALDGVFEERLERVAAAMAHRPEAMRIVEFIRADARRPLMAPARSRHAEVE
jgi:UDP-N-acetylglucosamine acyltransferase